MESIAKEAGALGAVFAKEEQTAESAPMTIEAAVRRNLELYFDSLQGAQPHAHPLPAHGPQVLRQDGPQSRC